MPSLSFPMRLQQNGLLERGEQVASLIALLQMMARTPQGSWQACPAFGFRDLFEDRRLRSDTAALTQIRINATLEDLGITDYVVTDVVREISSLNEMETYSITLQDCRSHELFNTSVVSEQ
jgi:hypothetical protein